MNNRDIFEQVCAETSRCTTRSFSTSFSLGIASLDKRFHAPIRAIYGFVRFADEIVDTFHGHAQQRLLDRFEEDTYLAIDQRISLNPILHSFQHVVHRFDLDLALVDTFLNSMRMDLQRKNHDDASYKAYILGSAESVGLMCLKVFAENDTALYERLEPAAMRLGAAFQKVNFLRDLRQDGQDLGRSYFPGIDPSALSPEGKLAIEQEIQADLDAAYKGILALPRGSRRGVRLAYLYYRALFRRIQRTPANRMLHQRIRVPQGQKLTLLVSSYVQHRLNLTGTW